MTMTKEEKNKADAEARERYDKGLKFAELARRHSSRLNEETLKFDKEPDWDKAFHYWTLYAETTANGGNCQELAECYYYGRGTPVDYAKAVDCFAKTTNGYAYMFSLLKKAAPEFRRLAFEYYWNNNRSGSFDVYIADCYCFGYGTEADGEKAFEYYKKIYARWNEVKDSSYSDRVSANTEIIAERDGVSELAYAFLSEQKDARGVGCFGIWHFHRERYGEALELLKKSDEMGGREASYYVGQMYRYGLGVEKDGGEAFYWYKKSAAKGYRAGEFALADCYQEGIGVEADRDKAHGLRMSAIF